MNRTHDSAGHKRKAVLSHCWDFSDFVSDTTGTLEFNCSLQPSGQSCEAFTQIKSFPKHWVAQIFFHNAPIAVSLVAP